MKQIYNTTGHLQGNFACNLKTSKI